MRNKCLLFLKLKKTSKEEITSLAIMCPWNICEIKDFSGLYEFPNLTSLYIDVSEGDAYIDFTKIAKLKKLSINSLDIGQHHNLDKLVNLGFNDGGSIV